MGETVILDFATWLQCTVSVPILSVGRNPVDIENIPLFIRFYQLLSTVRRV